MKKGGSLRFWGDCFGRPFDNFHRPVSAELDGGALVIRFDGGEKCVVFAPSGIVNERDIFRVESADKIIWEWYYYGRPRTPENLRKREYTRAGNSILVEYAGERSFVISADGFALELY